MGRIRLWEDCSSYHVDCHRFSLILISFSLLISGLFQKLGLGAGSWLVSLIHKLKTLVEISALELIRVVSNSLFSKMWVSSQVG